jgi:hypothetical protein
MAVKSRAILSLEFDMNYLRTPIQVDEANLSHPITKTELVPQNWSIIRGYIFLGKLYTNAP